MFYPSHMSGRIDHAFPRCRATISCIRGRCRPYRNRPPWRIPSMPSGSPTEDLRGLHPASCRMRTDRLPHCRGRCRSRSSTSKTIGSVNLNEPTSDIVKFSDSVQRIPTMCAHNQALSNGLRRNRSQSVHDLLSLHGEDPISIADAAFPFYQSDLLKL